MLRCPCYSLHSY